MTFVYFLKQALDRKGNSPIKIGVTDDVSARVKALSTGSPHPITLIKTVICENRCDAEKLERALHHIASKKGKRLNGEWFMIYGSINKMIDDASKMARVEIARPQ